MLQKRLLSTIENILECKFSYVSSDFNTLNYILASLGLGAIVENQPQRLRKGSSKIKENEIIMVK